MGRTIPSFRLAIAMEKVQWKPFCDALDRREERKQFDGMLDVPRLYLSACSYAGQNVRIYPILIPILLDCYKQLVDCTAKVENMTDTLQEGETRINQQRKRRQQQEEEKQKDEGGACLPL